MIMISVNCISAGQSSTLGMTATTGCTVIIRSKFSVGRFWRDCSEYDATVAQYIGEMCRFLLGEAILFMIVKFCMPNEIFYT